MKRGVDFLSAELFNFDDDRMSRKVEALTDKPPEETLRAFYIFKGRDFLETQKIIGHQPKNIPSASDSEAQLVTKSRPNDPIQAIYQDSNSERLLLIVCASALLLSRHGLPKRLSKDPDLRHAINRALANLPETDALKRHFQAVETLVHTRK